MAKTTILVADNNEQSLKTVTQKLEREGYTVLQAKEPSAARFCLQYNTVDVAVLDLRLENDNDEKDISGLNIAKEYAPSVPKVIYTAYESVETLREALAPNLHGLSPVVQFVFKTEGAEGLVRAVKTALALAGSLRRPIDEITGQLQKDYEEARNQARHSFVAALTVSLTGVAVILFGAYLTLRGDTAIGTATAIGGIVTEAVSLLFFVPANSANKRMDNYHAELLQNRWLESLLAACEELPGERQRVFKEKVIRGAIDRWFGPDTRKEPTVPNEAAQ